MKYKELNNYVQDAIISIIEERKTLVEDKVKLAALNEEVTQDKTSQEIQEVVENQLDQIKFLFNK